MQTRISNVSDLLHGVEVLKQEMPIRRDVDNIVFDSRKANKESLFVAIKGRQADGHQYLSQVIERGTKVIVVEDWFENDSTDLIQVQVKDSAKALAIIAGNFFDNPSRKIKLTGVTGTNGKSTIVSLLKQMFDGLGFKTGLLSTIRNVVVDKEFVSTHTTPNPVELNMLLAEMVKAGCSYAFMEVSSHAIDQERIAGLDFDIAIFTNISHDHLNLSLIHI